MRHDNYDYEAQFDSNLKPPAGLDHLKHMAAVRPGSDGEACQWALAEIKRLRDDLLTARAKVGFARGEIDRARRATNLAMEYLVDAELATVRHVDQ